MQSSAFGAYNRVGTNASRLYATERNLKSPTDTEDNGPHGHPGRYEDNPAPIGNEHPVAIAG